MFSFGVEQQHALNCQPPVTRVIRATGGARVPAEGIAHCTKGQLTVAGDTATAASNPLASLQGKKYNHKAPFTTTGTERAIHNDKKHKTARRETFVQLAGHDLIGHALI